MAKAGSTAIQIALLNKEDALKEANILNPITGRRRGAHWGLLEEIRDAREPVHFSQLSAESRDYPLTVISCEAYWFLTDDGIRRLIAATDPWDVHVILYLRRPGDFLGSSYRQHIKTGKISGTPQEFLIGLESRLEYDNLIKRWSRYFPLTVKVYDIVRPRIEQDFLEHIGAGHLKTDRFLVNRTPPDGATRLMLLANRCFSKRSRRRRAIRKIQAVQSYFSWMAPIDNTAFYQVGQRAVAKWDREVLLQYLHEDDLAVLAAV
jgi:hypothetical protein